MVGPSFITLNEPSKELVIPDDQRVINIYSDNRGSRKLFKFPRIVGSGLDVAECDVFVEYKPSTGKLGNIPCPILSKTDTEVIFAWAILKDLFPANVGGTIKYAVKVREKVANGKVYQTLSTTAECHAGTGSGDFLIESSVILHILKRLSAIENSAGGNISGGISIKSTGGTPVYCWGDSLTQGIGGNVDGLHLISYPQILGERCNAVNLGILSDDVPTIQARQGSVKALLPACTIPGSSSESVTIGNLADGLPTRDGRSAKLLKYGDAGINPCYINNEPCILFRDYKESTIDGCVFKLRRLYDGNPITVSANTELDTYASRHYRGNGIHIFWMGANGGYGNLTANGTDLDFNDYVARLDACVAYADSDNYVIVYAREGVGYWHNEPSKVSYLAQHFKGHFINLLPQMRDRGLLYGETSNWDGTLIGGCPNVLDSGDGCHYSFYGYRAIANIVWEMIAPLLNGDYVDETGGETPTPPSEPPEPTGDNYGEWAYKLEQPVEFTNSTPPIDTRFAPFAANRDEFTIVIKTSPEIGANNRAAKICWQQTWGKKEDNTDGAVATCIYADTDIGEESNITYLISTGGFQASKSGMNFTFLSNEHRFYAITRQGDKYWVNVDKNLVYNTNLTYSTGGIVSNETVHIGGDLDGQNKFIGQLYDCRIYNKALTQSELYALIDDMR